jgi:hypothetical protein
VESDLKLPNLSIATKLYLIFALLATVTVALDQFFQKLHAI